MRASLLLSSLLVACVGKGEVELHDSDEQETGETGEIADDTLCGAYSGFEAEGRVWIYDWAMNDSVGTQTVTLDELDALGQTAKATSRLDVATEVSSTVAVTELSYVCDADGLSVGTEYTSVERTAEGATTSDWTLVTYDPPWLLVGRDAREGAVWTGTTARTMEGGSSETVTESLSWTMTVAGTEDLTVTAGRYAAIRVESSGTLGQTTWLAEGVGMLKNGEAQLNSMVGG